VKEEEDHGLVGEVFNGTNGRGLRCKPTPDRDGLIITYLESRDEEITTSSYAEAADVCGEEALRVRLPEWGLTVDASGRITSAS
jgi:hypothetical protein